MPDEAHQWMSRIKAVEREYRVISLGMERLIQAVTATPALLPGFLRARDVRAAVDQLEGTYLVRLFSEFETALHHFCRARRVRRPGRAETLVNRVRDHRGIPGPITDDVHRVREYRNTLVHERTTPVAPVGIRDATKFLCTYLSWLQRVW